MEDNNESFYIFDNSQLSVFSEFLCVFFCVFVWEQRDEYHLESEQIKAKMRERVDLRTTRS